MPPCPAPHSTDLLAITTAPTNQVAARPTRSVGIWRSRERAAELQDLRIRQLEELVLDHPHHNTGYVRALIHKLNGCGSRYGSRRRCDSPSCYACALEKEDAIRRKREAAYARLAALPDLDTFLVTITARKTAGEDDLLHKRVVQDQTKAVLAALRSAKLLAASDVAPECHRDLFFHEHLVLWTSRDKNIEERVLAARSNAVNRHDPRWDGEDWIAPAPGWFQRAYDPAGLPSYFTKTARAVNAGELPEPEADLATALIMHGIRLWRPGGLLAPGSVYKPSSSSARKRIPQQAEWYTY